MSSHSSQNTQGSGYRSGKKPHGFDSNSYNEYLNYTGISGIDKTPEQRTTGRGYPQQQPQISVPATPRMLSSSSRQTSMKKYAPATPPHALQQPIQLTSHTRPINETTFNNSSGETANVRATMSPSDSLRKDRLNFRNELDSSMHMGSPMAGRSGSGDRKRYERSFDKFANEVNYNGNKVAKINNEIPIIKIAEYSGDEIVQPRTQDSNNPVKAFNFIEAYEHDHKQDNILMPPPAFSSQQPASEKVLDNALETEHSKITVVDSGKKYKEFHRKSIGDWEFVQNIGSGSMGKVKVAKNMKTQELCAVKIVTRAVKTFLYKCEKDPQFRNSLSKEEYKEKLLKENSRDKRTVREGGLGEIFYHPNICRLFCTWALTTHYYMLFEYVQGGQLLDYIIQHGSLKEHRVRKFTRGIASAIKYLHGHNIVHRDLKIENILISDAGDIKIIDFGLSNFFNVNSKLKTFCGSLYFAAPELLKAEPYIGPEVDIWAFGIVMFVLLCGKVPFDNDRSDVLHKLIKEGNVEYPSHLSESVKSLLKRMIVVDRDMRYNIDEINNHPWMNEGYDYNVLSHIPSRKPLVEIDLEVCEEMVRLAFFDNAVTLKQSLTELIESDDYVHLAEQHYHLFGNEYPKNGEDDPLLGFHANISLYHLVDEFFDRKDINRYSNKDKLLAASGISSPTVKVNRLIVAGNLNSPSQKGVKMEQDFADESYPYSSQSKRGAQSSEEEVIDTIPDYKHVTIKAPTRSRIEENNISSPLQEQQPMATGLGLFSPVKPGYKPQKTESLAKAPYNSEEPQQGQDKFRFGSLFRRFSQNKKKSSGPVPNQTQGNDDQSWGRSHKRTVSEGGAIQNRGEHLQTGIKRLPALPMNADLLVKREQQRYNSTNESGQNPLDTIDYSLIQSSKNNQLVLPDSENREASRRGFHPNARAKSVGGYITTSNQNINGMGSAFIDNKTVDQIMKEAADAPKDSMPSIEYPKVFFLKNFFSVQTTSFLPLPVVRYEIIKTLRHMSIEFKEIPGAFVCTHSNQPLPKDMAAKNDTLDDITSAYYDDNDSSLAFQKDTGKNNISRRGSVMRKAYKEQIPQTPNISANWNHSSSANTPRSPNVGDVSLEYDDSYDYDEDQNLKKEFEGLNIDNQATGNRSSKTKMMITDDSKMTSLDLNENGKVVFEIHIVKVPVIGTAGVHFKKISGNTWNYKTLASNILDELNL